MIDDFVVLILMMFIFSVQLTELSQSLPDISDIQAYSDAVDDATKTFMFQYFPYVLLLKVIYQGVLIGYNGMTVGKYLTKTRVVNLDGSKIGFNAAIFRAVVRIASELLFYMGFLVAFFTPKSQTMHGLISRSIVIDATRD